MSQGQCIALLDANILYSAPVRDIFLQLTITGLFRVRWTVDIHNEWIESLLKNQPSIKRNTLERTRALMDQEAGDCLISGYEKLISSLELPDPKDRHVLAAAIVGCCNVIITYNLSDFPQHVLAQFGMLAQYPDEFLCNQMVLAPGVVCNALCKVRARLKKPPYSINDYLSILSCQGLTQFVSELKQCVHLL